MNSINLREALSNDQLVIGSWINTGSQIVAEIMSQSGFDFLTLDAEHSPIDTPQIHSLVQAIKAGSNQCAPIARVPKSDYYLIKRYLDAGITGIIAPLVNTREDAEELISATKYPPLGNRGVGYCAANQYGSNIIESLETSNNSILSVVQIEHQKGVENIDDILSVPEIDAVFIGPYDLSASLGIPGEFDDPKYIEARDKIFNSCKQHSIPIGIHVVQPNVDEFVDYAKKGYKLIAYSLDITILSHIAKQSLTQIKERC
jgi:2-dehydro-3-deoxyglucarate aldolase